MNQKKQVSPEDQYLGVDPLNIIRMQIEIAVEALTDIADSSSMSNDTMKKTAYDAINELEMIDAMYTYGFKD
tara:strand:- start:1995 stop:2210 length:216 start_codon:yes stop_codon:yes gene_type:complete